MDYLRPFLTTFLFILYNVKDVDVQSIQNKPRNTAALADSEVTLECTFSGPPEYVRWKEYITTDAGRSIFSRNSIDDTHPRKERYSVIPTGGTQYNLTVRPLKAEDAGYYACSGTDHERPKYGAYIMHLGPKSCNTSQSGKVVGTVVEGEQFTVFCQRDYSSVSGWPPILQLRELTFTTNSTTATNVRYEVTLQAEASLNGKKYHCTTTFINPPPFKPTDETFEDDNRLPALSEADCETTIEVHWPAKNIVRVPEKNGDPYYPEEQVKCSAQANPSPTEYKWSKLQGNGPQEVPGQTLTITNNMIGNSVYDCIVTNRVKGVLTNMSRNFTFSVEARPTTVIPTTWTPLVTTAPYVPTSDGTHGPGERITGGGLSGGAIAGIVIGCLVGVAVIIALIICCLMRSKKEEDTKPMSLQKTQKAGNGVDQVRGGPYMPTDLAYTNNADNRSPTGTGPPPYDPRYPNQPDGGLQYADLQFNSSVDDTPRSRKPIQMSDPGNATVYADIRRV